jgi:hypothetical protein
MRESDNGIIPDDEESGGGFNLTEEEEAEDKKKVTKVRARATKLKEVTIQHLHW